MLFAYTQKPTAPMPNTPYQEALRYLQNAKDTLLKAGKDGGLYKDKKYVKAASGIAYKRGKQPGYSTKKSFHALICSGFSSWVMRVFKLLFCCFTTKKAKNSKVNRARAAIKNLGFMAYFF